MGSQKPWLQFLRTTAQWPLSYWLRQAGLLLKTTIGIQKTLSDERTQLWTIAYGRWLASII